MTEHKNGKERADFHVHLGDREDADIVREALDNHVTVVAVMDRGIVRIEKVRRLVALGEKAGIIIVPGVECFTEIQDKSGKTAPFELIGLDFNLGSPTLFNDFDPRGEVYSGRHDVKVTFQREFLENQGFNMTPNEQTQSMWDIVNSAQILDTAVRLCGIAAQDKATISRLIQSTKFQSELESHHSHRPQDRGDLAKFLYWKYFAYGTPGYKKWHPEPKTIIDSIKKSEGVVLLAHPRFQHVQGDLTILDVMADIFKLGIDGLEGWDHGNLDIELAIMARRRGLLVLGGSGRDISYNNRILGRGAVGEEEMFISPRRLKELKAYPRNR